MPFLTLTEVITLVADPKPIRSRHYLLPSLTQPSVDVATEFIREVVPSTVFGSGEDRRRRCPGNLGATDQGYLVFYRQEHPDHEPQQVPLRSPDSILRYLEAQLEADLAEHWVCLQSTQYRSCRRDGRRIRGATFGATNARHLLLMVVDMDPSLMGAEVQRMIREDWPGFVALVSNLLEQLGVAWWRIIRSSAGGVHVYVRFVRPDGRPLGANDKTRGVWERTAQALNRYFAMLGADPNTVKLTQPFVLPGLPRLKHGGYVPYVAAGRDGEYTDLYALYRELIQRKLVHRAVAATAEALDGSMDAQAGEFLAEVREHACGLSDGRKRAVYGIAVAGLAKGASEEEVWQTLCAFNDRCTPPLSEKQLRKALLSAQRCETRQAKLWPTFGVVPWNRLRGELGMPIKHVTGFRRDGRWRPITPPKPRELRVREHYEELEERLLRFVAGEGGCVRMTQEDIADRLGSNRSTVKAVLRKLVTEERLIAVAKRGAGGGTEMRLPVVIEKADPLSEAVSVNGQSRIAPVGGGEGCVGGSEGSGAVAPVSGPAEVAASIDLVSPGRGHGELLALASAERRFVERAQRELWAGTIDAMSLLCLLELVEVGVLVACLRAARARAIHARSLAHREAVMVGLERLRMADEGWTSPRGEGYQRPPDVGGRVVPGGW